MGLLVWIVVGIVVGGYSNIRIPHSYGRLESILYVIRFLCYVGIWLSRFRITYYMWQCYKLIIIFKYLSPYHEPNEDPEIQFQRPLINCISFILYIYMYIYIYNNTYIHTYMGYVPISRFEYAKSINMGFLSWLLRLATWIFMHPIFMHPIFMHPIKYMTMNISIQTRVSAGYSSL